MIQVSKKYYYFIHITLLALILLVIGLSSVICIGYFRYEDFVNFLIYKDSKETQKLIFNTNEIRNLADFSSNEIKNEIKKLSQQINELNDSINRNKISSSNERKLLRGLLNEMIKVMDANEK